MRITWYEFSRKLNSVKLGSHSSRFLGATEPKYFNFYDFLLFTVFLLKYKDNVFLPDNSMKIR